jgi:hypothetical protein
MEPMPGKRRIPPRFKIGDKVKILPTIANHFAGKHGVILEVRESERAHTLDKYSVHLDSEAQTAVFWDIQLIGVDSLGEA